MFVPELLNSYALGWSLMFFLSPPPAWRIISSAKLLRWPWTQSQHREAFSIPQPSQVPSSLRQAQNFSEEAEPGGLGWRVKAGVPVSRALALAA